MVTITSAGTAIGRQRTLLLIACTAAYCLANATWWVQPVLIEQFISGKGYTASAAGLVVSAEMAAMALTAFVLAKLLKETRFLPIGALGVAIVITASLVSLTVSSYEALVMTRLIAGVGEGVILMIANTAVVHLGDPDKTFGRMGTVNIIAGAVGLFLLPLLHTTGPTPSALIALTGAFCVLAPGVLLMPASIRSPAVVPEGATAQNTLSAGVRFRLVLLCVAMFIVGLASGVMWSFYAVIGMQAGLDAAAVNAAIGTSILAGIGGASLAAVLGNSYGRLLPVSVGVIALSAAIAALSFHPTASIFRIATCVNLAAIYLLVPYFFSAGSAQDTSGRGAAFVGSAFVMTGAISPYLGGMLVDTVGTAAVGIGVIVTSVIAWLLFAHVDRQKAAPATQAIMV